MKIIEQLKKLLKSSPNYVTVEDQETLEKALIGKTIEKVAQIPLDYGWLTIYLKMTDGTAIHFGSKCNIRVQLNNNDGSKSYLPTNIPIP